MKNEEMTNLTNSIRQKLGDEASAKISDDLGTLITNNAQMNKDISERDTKIDNLQKDKESLIETNGNLLKQVSMGFDDRGNKNEEKDDKPKSFNFKDCFDEKGNFK